MWAITKILIACIFCISFIVVASADYGFQSEWTVSAEDIQSKPAFGDLNDDGLKEIIISSNDMKLYVLYPNGTIFWTYSVAGMSFVSSPNIGNVDDDEDLEIAVGGGYFGQNLYVWDHDGTLKYHIINTTFNGDVYSSPVLFDINLDGKDEVTIGCVDYNVYIFDENGNSIVNWPQEVEVYAYIYSDPAVGDIDADNSPDIVVSSTNGKVYALDRNGIALDGWPVDIGGSFRASPIIADIDNNGVNEVIIGSSVGGLYVLKGDGTNLGNWPADTGEIWYSSPVVGDIDGDGDLEVVIGCNCYKVYAFHHDGTTVNGWPFDFSSRGAGMSSTPALADVDNDGQLEVIINTKRDLLYLINGDGTILDSISTTAWKGSPNAADIDNDGDIEVVIGSDVIQLFSIINPPPVASILSPGNGFVVHNYGDIPFIGSGADDGSIVSYNWMSDVNGTIGSAASIDSPLSVGWHNITFTVEDNNGATDNESIRIRVNSVPFMTIVSPSDSIVIDHGSKISFNGTGIDIDGTIGEYNWTSDIDGEISNSTSFDTTALSVGIHSISLNGIDNDGAVGSASVQVKVNALSSSDSGSSGGGGVPTGGGEPIDNVVSKDVKREYVAVGGSIKYEFKESAINGVVFDAKTNAGYVSVTVEVLKHTSKFVNDLIPGVVYKNLNIWVGESGYATEENIENSEISFSVEKSWVSQYHIDGSTIGLNRYHDGKWNKLTTVMVSEDNDYFYFMAKTPGFSPFAITGDSKTDFKTMVEIPTEMPKDGGDTKTEDVLPVSDTKLSGFSYLFAVAGIFLASLLLLRK